MQRQPELSHTLDEHDQLAMMQAQVEKLEAQVQDLERQSAKMGGRTDMNGAEMDPAPARKKRRVVKSEWQEELDLLSEADLAKLLQMTKSLVEAREELIAEKGKLVNNINEACSLLKQIRVHAGRSNTRKLAEDDSESGEVSKILKRPISRNVPR